MQEPLSATEHCTILIFRTMSDVQNNNKGIELSLSRAFGREFPNATILRSSIENAISSILALRPTYAIGIGSVASDANAYRLIHGACKQVGSVLGYWLLDDPYEFDFNWKIFDFSDWIFSTDRATLDYYPHKRWSHLPLAADSVEHFRKVDYFSNKTCDVFFCGYAYSNRLRIVDRLSPILRQVKTRIVGVNWNTDNSFCKNVRVPSADLPDLYNASSLVLYMGRDMNIANGRYEIVPSTPGPRLFEAAAAGSTQVFFFETAELADYFEIGKEVLVFNDVQQFEIVIRTYLDDPMAMAEIATAAQARVARDHTYENRATTIMNKLAERKASNG